jgi:cytochrome c553
MSKSLFCIAFGVPVIAAAVAMVAVSAWPANAADDVETKAQMCNACHSQNGAPITPIIPIIWGQQSNYLYKELHDYHSGARDNPIMATLAKGFALDDLRKIADYFAAKSWPAASAGAAASPPEAIAGKMVQCRLCHGQNFEGGAPAPRLAGLSYDYLAASMRGFANGERTNNLDMPGFMKALTDAERDAIAHYLSAE